MFVPPTVDEVREYCLARKNGIDPQEFVDYYAARGWMAGEGQNERLESCCADVGEAQEGGKP